MATYPRPPASDLPGFGNALQAWLDATGWSKSRLARLAGINRAQVARWCGEGQKPKGAAARKYEAFRQGESAVAIAGEMQELSERLKEIQKISWSDD